MCACGGCRFDVGSSSSSPVAGGTVWALLGVVEAACCSTRGGLWIAVPVQLSHTASLPTTASTRPTTSLVTLVVQTHSHPNTLTFCLSTGHYVTLR